MNAPLFPAPRRATTWLSMRMAAMLIALCAGAQLACAQSFVAEWSTDDVGRMGPGGVALDAVGGVTYLYVTDDPYGRVVKFNAATGARVAILGETGTNDGQFNGPFGIAVDPVSHDLYVAERRGSRIQRITNTGQFVLKWGMPGTGTGQLNSPVGIAADGAGNVYVADYGNDRIQKFRVQGTTVQHVAAWGSTGSGNGQFRGPYGITLDASGNLWVADTRNHRLQKFDANGNFLGAVGASGTGDGQFITPTAIAFDGTGAYYVTETNTDPSNLTAPDIQHQRVQKFAANGTFVAKWGTLGEAGGQFRCPNGIVADASNIFVGDYYNTRVQKFSASGSSGGGSGGGGSAGRFTNLSSRLGTVDGDGSRDFIAGFAVNGSGPKAMLIRAVGPGLVQFNVSGTLPNPKVQIFAGAQVVAENDNWGGNAAVKAACERLGAFGLDAASADAALLVTLAPGTYTAKVSANGGQGVALVEVYDADSAQPTQLVNLSTRGFVGTGDNVLVAGFYIAGSAPKRVLIRGIGPTLSVFNVSGAVADSMLRIYGGETLIAQNNDWQTPQTVSGGPAPATGAQIAAAASSAGAFELQSGSKDAAIVVTLQPGLYSAIVSGANNATGAGLVEVYELASP